MKKINVLSAVLVVAVIANWQVGCFGGTKSAATSPISALQGLGDVNSAGLRPAVTTGSLSVGKFYTFSMAESASYPDRWSNQWTDGARLTDEELVSAWPLTDWVGWQSSEPYEFEIVVDLGKDCDIEQVKIHFGCRAEWGIYYPESVQVEYKAEQASDWVSFGTTMDGPADTSGYSTAWVQTAGTGRGRYVKYIVSSAGQHTFVDEIDVIGKIENSFKAVPDWGVYHGAFPSDENGWLMIGSFERLVERKISIALWYAKMGSCDFANYLGSLWLSQYGLKYNLDYNGARFLQVGWEPETNITAEQIAGGYYDSYFKQFFLESINYSNRGGNTDFVWFRPMSEMNGSWCFPPNAAAWGGDTLRYRQAWRRMINIAEQVGALDKHIFIWSPNAVSYPSDAWNQPAEYYPGDQYVDWVGISVYAQTASPYPNTMIAPFAEQWSYKPIIVSEGAYMEKDGIDGIEWINQWFDINKTFDNVKAMVWFHRPPSHGLLFNSPYKELYQQRVQDADFLDKTVAGVADLNGDYVFDFMDYAGLAKNWRVNQSNLAGDINGDNVVNENDLDILSWLWLK